MPFQENHLLQNCADCTAHAQENTQYAITSAIFQLFVHLQLRQSWKLKARPCITDGRLKLQFYGKIADLISLLEKNREFF